LAIAQAPRCNCRAWRRGSRRSDDDIRDAPAQADAERRQLTVMFCDLVGSTALAARSTRGSARGHRGVSPCRAEVCAGFDGFVAKYMGDGVLVYFGYRGA